VLADTLRLPWAETVDVALCVSLCVCIVFCRSVLFSTQVITTLARVIKCSQRDAIEFVTNIDREGRAVVKCSTFQHCSELKTDIERFTARHGNRPLKVPP
jgi:hypothetical protein